MTVAALMPAASEAGAEIKPRMRGLLHAWSAPVAATLGVLMVLLADGAKAATATTVWAVSLTGLFAVSATYHRGRWTPAVRAWMQRVDHSMIFVLIAGSYTPFALLLMQGSKSWIVLTITWGGAIAGIITRLTWHNAPRWLFVPCYIALGWVAVIGLPDLVGTAPPAANLLLLAGGILYTLGAVVFALKRPNPWPEVFGFHEVFHVMTILAAGCHAASLALVVT